jgi:hypothetical protein
MTRWVKNAFAMAALCAAAMAWATLPQAPKAPSSDEQAALAADRSFVLAVSKSNTATLDKLLDADFTWTDANGKTLTRAEVLGHVPKPLIDPGLDPEFQSPGSGPLGSRTSALLALENYHNYGEVEVIQVKRFRDNVLRVWVKRPAGWRQLVYQEVRLMDTPPVATPGTGQTCENPCKAVPYQPKSQNERDVLAGYMALQTYTVTHDSANWGKYVADEFAAANSNSNQTLDKRGRMEDLERSKMAGYSPMPVVQMRIFDFGNAAILVTQHQPERGKPVHITRVWIKRDAKWLEAASYQTRIESAPAKP